MRERERESKTEDSGETISASSSLTLEQGEEKHSGVATGHAGLSQLGVVVSLLPGLDERQEGKHVVRQREKMSHSTLP